MLEHGHFSIFKSVIMNQINISGNLTDSIELRHFDKNSVSKFTIAVNNERSDNKETAFIPVEVWNQEHLAKFLDKGSKVLVTGSVKQERWETKNGEKRNRIVVVGRNVEFLDPPRDNKRDSSSGRR
jgi:single-strand DNA-binding protein